MNTVIDTDILIRGRGSTNVSSRFFNQHASVISRAELAFGVRTVQHTNELEARRRLRYIQALDTIPNFWVPFGISESNSYGILAAHTQETAPSKARSKDALIAATAHANGVPVWTKNLRDFHPFTPHIDLRDQ